LSVSFAEFGILFLACTGMLESNGETWFFFPRLLSQYQVFPDLSEQQMTGGGDWKKSDKPT
jgi:hypothetical protein